MKDFAKIKITMVRGQSDEKLNNALINTYHYFGYHQGGSE
jgi:hypothetical protein